LSKEKIYRYECCLCRNHDYAKALPIDWVEAYIDKEVSVDGPDGIHFCPEHAKIMTGGVPIRILNPDVRFNRGVSPSLGLMEGADIYPARSDRT
jgi:hypothetical protein